MPITPILALLVESLANLVLAILVLRRNPSSFTHKAFSALSLSFVTWSVLNYLSFSVTSYLLALWTVRLVMAFAVIQSFLLFILLNNFPRHSVNFNSPRVIIPTLLTALGLGLSLSPVLVRTVNLGDGYTPQPVFYFGLWFFIPITAGLLLTGFISLVIKSFRATGLEKTQQRYLLIGLVISFSLLVLLVLLPSAFYQDTTFVPYAPLLILPFSFFAAYTIIRYRLMDLRLALFRGLSLTFLVGSLLLIYSLILIFAVPWLADVTGLRGDLIAAVAALLSIPAARYVQRFLTNVTDRYLLHRPRDYQIEIIKISSELSGTIRIQDVTNIILRVMTNLVRCRQTVIYLQRSSGQELIPWASSYQANPNITIQPDHALLEYLRHTKTAAVDDNLKFILESERSPAKVENLKGIISLLKWLEAEVIIPLFVDKELIGLIVLGNKLTGEPYSLEDLNFLNTLAPQAATALENARLYQESLEFGKRLKLEVDEATHELALANSQLRNLDKAKSEFLSVASHQLNTPLTPIRGYLSMLLEGDYGKVPTRQRSILKLLEKSTSQLVQLIKNYLDLSRIESGRLELNLESLDLAQIATDIIKELSPNALAKELKLNFAAPAQTVNRVVADRERIRQVILNLVDNAIKYTEHGAITLAVQSEGDEVKFAVSDTGRGLTSAEISRLFTKFTRVGGKEKYRAEGTGLGLYVAKQIVGEHHGRVVVTSSGLKKGSTFAIYLPSEGSPRSLKLNAPASTAAPARSSGHTAA